jgi:hypothetical protein
MKHQDAPEPASDGTPGRRTFWIVHEASKEAAFIEAAFTEATFMDAGHKEPSKRQPGDFHGPWERQLATRGASKGQY